jgi:two-component system, LytTR family, sensor kinase
MTASTNNLLRQINNRKSSTMYAAISTPESPSPFVRLRFYLWVGAAFLTFLLLADFGQGLGQYNDRVWNNCWRVVYITAVNFLFFEYIVPLLSWKKPMQSLLLLGGQFLLYTFVFYGWRVLGIFLHIQTPFGVYDTLTEGVCDNVPYTFLSCFVFGISKHVYTYLGLKQMTQQLRIEKQAAELNYLKSQTNPHFLFNTLNNIYALAADKSDLTPESILRLSAILRFMLYETNVPTIRLEQEVQIISDYMALEQLRYDERLRVVFEVDMADPKQPIPPLLLIPLVENAFKHGAAETRNAPFVEIRLRVQAQTLYFQVVNSVESVTSEAPVRERIGLSNLRRQLELLYKKYQLSLQPAAAQFTATLQIDLSSHV